MLEQLKFVRGSVAKKDLLPALTHFRIENGHIQGYNGKLALSTPIDFDIDCTPEATTLINSIGNCKEAIQLGMTKAGKLSIKSGKFKAFIKCIEGPTAHVQPEGQFVDIDGQVLLNALKTLQPYVCTDAAKPWTNGVHFHGSSAFATNNVIVAEHWLGTPFPISFTVPRDAVRELIRINQAPERFQISDSSMTFHYADGRWARCGLLGDNAWPLSIINGLLENVGACEKIPESFFEGLNSVEKFTDKFNRVVFEPGLIRTHALDCEEGATYELDWIKNKSTFSIEMLQKLKGIAKGLDLTKYPDPCPWYGDNIRGVIVGMHWIEGEI